MSSPLFARPARSTLPAQAEQTRKALLETLSEIDPDTAAWVRKASTDATGKPSAVVVGETKRGKSSLVNALLARPNLSPVDADIATSTYLVFSHADAWQARACYPGQMPEIPIELDELELWTSATRELPDGQLPPRYVEVSGPCPLLTQLSLVDTPGVGGLDSMHGELAMEAAASATALLFVVDASAPFTSSELSFLSRMSDRVETVLFVLTKTDAFRGWRQVADANARLLAEHAPRFADATFHPVSARMFEMAAKAPNEQAATMLRQKSGIVEVQTLIQQELIGRAAMLAEANTLRTLVTAFDELEANLQAERRALTTGESEADALRERKEELITERRSSTRGWQLTLRTEIQRTRLECNHEVARQMRETLSWFRHEIDQAGADRLDELPGEVDSALKLVSSRMTAQLGTRLNQVAEAALSELFTGDELNVIRGQLARAGGPLFVVKPPDQRRPTAEDKLLVGMGSYMGVMGSAGASKLGFAGLTGVGMASGAAVLVMAPVVMVGLGAAWWIGKTRKHAANKQHVKQWLTDSIAEARSTFDQLVAEQIIEAEHELQLALDEALGRRIEAIESELKDVDKALKMGAQERSKQLSIVGKHLKDVGAGRERARKMLAGIRAVS